MPLAVIGGEKETPLVSTISYDNAFCVFEIVILGNVPLHKLISETANVKSRLLFTVTVTSSKLVHPELVSVAVTL